MTEEYRRKKNQFLELRKRVLEVAKEISFQPDDSFKTDCSQLESLTKWCQANVFVSEKELASLEQRSSELEQNRLELIAKIRTEAAVCDEIEASVGNASEGL